MKTIYDKNLYERNVIRAYILSKEGHEQFGSIVRDRYENQRFLIFQKMSLYAHDVCDFSKVSLHLNEYYTVVRYELDL